MPRPPASAGSTFAADPTRTLERIAGSARARRAAARRTRRPASSRVASAEDCPAHSETRSRRPSARPRLGSARQPVLRGERRDESGCLDLAHGTIRDAASEATAHGAGEHRVGVGGSAIAAGAIRARRLARAQESGAHLHARTPRGRTPRRLRAGRRCRPRRSPARARHRRPAARARWRRRETAQRRAGTTPGGRPPPSRSPRWHPPPPRRAPAPRRPSSLSPITRMPRRAHAR